MVRVTVCCVLTAAVGTFGCGLILRLEDHDLAPRTDPAGDAEPEDSGTVMDAGLSFGEPEVLARDLDAPRNLVSDDTSLYWTNEGSHTVSTVHKDGTLQRILARVISGQEHAMTLAVGASHVYFTWYAGCGAGGILSRVRLDATGSEDLPTAAGCRNATGIALDPVNVYLTFPRENKLSQIPIDKTTPTVLTSASTSLDSLATTDGRLMFSGSVEARAILRYTRGNTAYETFASGQPGAVSIALDEANAYWVTETGNIVTLGRDAAGAIPTVLASGQAMPRRLALGADRVYWTNASDGSVMTVAKTGGETTVVARGQAEPWGIAADAAGVYWVNHADGTVRRALRR